MKPKRLAISKFRFVVLVTIVFWATFSVFVFEGKAASTASYSYKFTVNAEGFTDVEVSFVSTDASGSSWVIVPKFSRWTYIVTSGSVIQSQNLSTTDVGLEDLYFYKVFSFSYRSTNTFGMKVQFDFEQGALIIENRGIFFSPQIGYQKSDGASGQAEVLFDSHLTVNQNKAIALGAQSYMWTEIGPQRVLFNLPRNEDLLRIQIEFTTSLTTQQTTLTSKNKVFTFTSPNRYVNDASNILNLYDKIYNNYTRLFNVTLTPQVGVQFFLPSFEEFLSVGGFVPFTETTGAGKINVNIFYIRAVNGTIEVIATHELVHHFLIKAGLSPNDFLWFHEGMAQYVSTTVVETLGYEGAQQEKDRLEQGASQLIGLLGGEKFDFLQDWSPSASPADVENYYVASYYVVNGLAQQYGGLDYYKRFFELIHGVNVDNIDVFTLYLSKAANASVALTLQEWGFNVFDLYTSPEIREKIEETQRAIATVNPFFQPYKSLAEFFYKQALLSFRRGDMAGGANLLQLAITIADLAPLLTLLTIAAILGLISFVLYRQSRKARMKPTFQPPPPEISPSST